MGGKGGVWVTGSWVLGVAVAFAASTAYADDAAQKRLSKHGKLSGGDANRVAAAVSARMKRAADMTGANDPLRMAVSNALFGTPVPADQVAAAKVRLRLYAGLNEWALDNLFEPRPGAVAACTSSYGLTAKDCHALLAAGGRTSVADAARQGGGGAAPVAPAPAYGQPQPQYGYAQPAAQPSRFGRYDSGFRPGAQPQPAAAAYGQPARPMYGQPARPVYGQPAARPMPVARPMPAARPAPPPPNPALAANRKAEYERKRQEYLERKKQEMEARKSKIVATAGGTDRVQRGPSSEAEAEAAGIEPSSVAPAAAPPKGAAAKAAPAPAAAEAPAEPAAKPALDNEFLDGLLDDPLGK